MNQRTPSSLASDLPADSPAGPFSPLDAPFRLITRDGIETRTHGGRTFLEIRAQVLADLAAAAFHDASFLLRPSHLDQWVAILADSRAHANERFVVASLIKNAIIAAEGLLPLCQDTGTATIVARRGERVLTGGDDEAALAEGVARAFDHHHLRYSQIAAKSMFDEANTGTNLPAQIEIGFAPGEAYDLLFIAKGGGSSNKTGLFQETKALLNDEAFEAFLRARIGALGVAACPPYHLAVVVGGTSPETNLKMLKLATAGALDHLPVVSLTPGLPPEMRGEPSSGGGGGAFRDAAWEAKALEIAAGLGLGAQFGGRWLALDARVIRLPRHAGSCPVSVGVSCSAHRQILGKITRAGAFLERLDTNPARLLPVLAAVPPLAPVKIDLDRPMDAVREDLGRLTVGALVSLTGPMVVARDLAHAALHARMQAGHTLPDYFTRHAVYYAGPAKTPPGMAIGSFGPTTAQRMDGYLDAFMARGGSLVTLAKGDRAPEVTRACKRHGGFYLGTIGGAAALLAREHVTASEVIDYPEFGMEAVRKITVRDLPAFVVVDHRGNGLYS